MGFGDRLCTCFNRKMGHHRQLPSTGAASTSTTSSDTGKISISMSRSQSTFTNLYSEITAEKKFNASDRG